VVTYAFRGEQLGDFAGNAPGCASDNGVVGEPQVDPFKDLDCFIQATLASSFWMINTKTDASSIKQSLVSAWMS